MTRQGIGRGHGVALYRQISRILEEEVRGRYQAGQWLPPEQELAQRFTVNRHTIRRAVDELVDAGMVERRHGRGIRVLDPAITYPLTNATRFTDNIAALGLAYDSRLLSKRLLPASDGVARHLQLGHAAEVVAIEILRLAQGRPVCVATVFFPHPRCATLLEDYDGGSIHEYFDRRWGFRPRRVLSLVTATVPMGDDAHLLRMPRKMPVLRVKSVNVEPATGRPVEYTISRFRSDSIQLEVTP